MIITASDIGRVDLTGKVKAFYKGTDISDIVMCADRDEGWVEIILCHSYKNGIYTLGDGEVLTTILRGNLTFEGYDLYLEAIKRNANDS